MATDMPDWLLYEHQMCKVHRETTGHQVWHWSEIGLDLLVKAGYVDSLNKALYQAVEARRKGRPFGEYGIDGLSLDPEDVFHSLQAKIRNTSKVHARDLATFVNVVLLRLAQKNPLSRGYLYTNARLEINVFHDLFKRSGNFELRTMAPSTLRPTDAAVPVASAEVVAPCFTLRAYQVKALQALDEWEKDMFLLQQPCGTGKTLTFAEHAKKYKNVICIAPLMMSTRQNFDVVRGILGADYTSLLADSDGGGATRNPDRILEVMRSQKSFISATYKTFTDMVSDMIIDNPDLYKSMLVIVDEAHNATAEMMDVLEMLSTMDIKVLLSTATPPAALSAPEEDDIKFDAVQKIWRKGAEVLVREETDSVQTQESYRVQCLTAVEVMDAKILRAIEIMRKRISEGQTAVPPMDYTVGDWRSRFELLRSLYVKQQDKRKPASTVTEPVSDDASDSDSDSSAESDKKKQRV
ncbi:hypothetical protein JKP88DRAFT_276152 [Tribonema minus]|uniref:Helicase ATP-binding domain-containing protein n=1 Tax=Tribonema minus TaxID=303371 RepID=A0A836CJ62_9STRA|nr:hypothetical protein JKP88DRAFT_276152 [Tribonema minus]